MDAILVLGKELRGNPERARNELGARSAAASIAWRRSGGQVFTLEGVLRGQGQAGCEIVRDYLLDLGVTESSIVAKPWTCSTREEVLLSARLMNETGARKLGVITSAYHVARCRRYFVECGISGWVHTPEVFLKWATDEEKMLIVQGTPGAEALAEEATVERRLGRAEAVLRGFPPSLRWRMEVKAGRWFRALRREWVAPAEDGR